MTDPAAPAEARTLRTLAALVGMGIANHVALAGGRITVSLYALSQGGSPFVVGMLMALYALLPALSAVFVGRLSDRVGARLPMRLGSAGIAVGSAVPCIVPGMPALYVSACLVGTGFMIYQVSAQHVTGELGGGAERARNFSVLALGYSVSGFLGPLVVGFTIDHFGFRAAFAVLALVPFIPLAVLSRLALPRTQRAATSTREGGVMELLRHRTLRRVLIINALLAIGWDLNLVFVPIYGARIGLSASEIGMILASFAAATFAVRLLMPLITRRRTEHQVLAVALFAAAAVYVVFPFSQNMITLAALSFCLGLGLGSGQPLVLSLLHAHAPPGRLGEAAGVRMSLVNAMSVSVPLLFGAIGASLGLLPVFWTVGVSLAAGGVMARRGAK